MSSFIAIIGKDSTENLDICIESLCFGVTTKGNTANSHAKEAQVGDKLYFWVSGSGYDGYAQISRVEKVSSDSKIPNWTAPKQVKEISNPWSYLLHFEKYEKLPDRKYFSFTDGVQEITGVMDRALINNSEVTMKDESKEERFLRMIAPRVKKAVKAIDLIGNLGNKSLYAYSDTQKKKVFKYIDDAVAQMKKDLDKQTKDSNQDYDFT